MTRTVTKSMLQTLLNESRPDLAKSKADGIDTYSLMLQVSPVHLEVLGDELASCLEFEIDCLSRTGKYSFDKGFMPDLSKFSCFEKYYVTCYNILAKALNCGGPINKIADPLQPAVVGLLSRYCQLPEMVSCLSASRYLDALDVPMMNKLIFPSAEMRSKLLTDLASAKTYPEVFTVTHNLVMSPAEVKSNYAHLTKLDLNAFYVTAPSGALDHTGMPALANYSISAADMLKLSCSNPNHELMQAVHASNLHKLDLLKDKMKEEAKAAEVAKAQEAIKAEGERRSSINEKVLAATATAAEIREFLTWG
ncbi:hypothetical protein V6E00_05935 [Serratia marcescens]|uniref:hypothetical protein n=1 Tax=Serratia TaxID=613 RepID=UPI002FD93595